MEIRFIKAAEVRTTGPRQIGGLAAPYGVRAKFTGFQETIARGAFDRIVRSNPDVVCLFNHDPNCVLGRTSSGTMRIFADARGLNYECDLPNTQAARDLHESIQRGDIAGNSFAFLLEPGDDDFNEDYDPEDRSRVVLRTIRNFSKLQDISPVTYPAYSGTELAARCEHIPAEVRSRLASKGIVLPEIKKTDPDKNALDSMRLIAETALTHAEQQTTRTARRNLLNQV